MASHTQTLNALPVAYTNDPLLGATQNKKIYSFVQSGAYHNYQSIPVSNGSSNSGFNFNLQSPGNNLYLNRSILLEQPVDIAFTGTSSPGGTLLNQGYDAFRFMPLASVMNMLSVQLNGGANVNIPVSQCVQQLMRSNVGSCLKNREYSTTAAGAMDASQNYDDLANSIRNPLASYEDSNNGNGTDMGRGGYGFMDILTNTSTTAHVTATLTEPLFVSPLFYGKLRNNCDAFYGVNNITFNVNWANSLLLQRIWSHSNAAGSNITSITVNFGTPKILVSWITPSILERPLPDPLGKYEWNYNLFEQYSQDSGIVVTPNQTVKVVSQNINLSVDPSLIYVCCYNKPLQSMTFTDPDCFMRIESVSCQYGNQNGVLSNCNRQQLYELSVKNGLNMSYTEWGGVVQRFIGGNLTKYGCSGGGVLICPPLDFPRVDPLQAAGQTTSLQLQISMVVTNINQTTNALPSVSVITVSEGLYQLYNGQCLLSQGVINRENVLDAERIDVPFDKIRLAENGGDFGSVFKKFWNVLRNDVIPVVKDVVPLVGPVSKILSPVGRLLGGECCEDGGVYVGGVPVGGAYKKKRKGGALVNDPHGGALVSYSDMRRRLN